MALDLAKHREYIKWKLRRFGVFSSRFKRKEKATEEGQKLAKAMFQIAQKKREVGE